jgi:SAM-dependent MidA family methyltransferase
VAASLERGYAITIDYGYTSDELYNGRRSGGTLVCYHKHTVNDNVYHAIGEQDITSHVNFSALCHWGLKNGLQYCGLNSLAGFLLSLGFKDYLEETLSSEAGTDIMSQVKKHAFLSHTLLLDMGLKYKVLIQRKGVEKMELLGLRV